MAVFPENMDKLDTSDTPGSLAKIENHIRYMQERMEFSMRNMTRNVSESGVSNAEIYVLMIVLKNSLSALTSTVQGIAGDVNTVKSEISTIKQDVEDLKSRVSALEEPTT